MFTYPPKPWVDGQVHQVVTEDGHYITGVYDMSSNTWNLHHGTSGGHAGGLVMTTDVKTINTPPDKPIPTGTRITYPNINTQLDANWALQKQIDDLRALTTSVWIGNSLEEPPLGQDGTVIYYLWYQTDNEVLLHYSVQQQAYVPIEGEGSAQIAFASIAPEFPSPFNAWFNTLSKEMHLAYNSQWWPISRNEEVTYLLAEYAKRVLFSDTAPTTGRLGEELQQGDFWWDTDALELLTYYNDQWFPVAIPPRQLEILRQELDQLYTYTSNNRVGIFDLRQETEGRLQTIEDQLEDIKPSLERGSWSHSMDTLSGFTTGKFNLYVRHNEEYCQTKQVKCISDAAGDIEAINKCNRDFTTCTNTDFTILDTWEDCNLIYINNIDDAGVSHGWDGVEPDEYLEIVNEDGSGFALYKVTSEVSNATAYSLFDLVFVQGEGAPNGLAKFKLFKMLEADPTDFVRKAGDTMKGRLNIQPDSSTPPLCIYPHQDTSDGTYVIRQFSRPYTNPETGGLTRDTLFYTTSSGDISGPDNWTPSRTKHLTNVQYVQDQVGKLYYPARYSWRVQTETSAGPSSGYIQFDKTSMSNSTEVRIHFKSYDGKLDLFDVDDSKVVYSGPTNSSMMLTGYYIGSDSDNKWKWKGTANITKIIVYERTGDHYFKCELGQYKTSNFSFTDGGRYYFTIPGLF